MRILMGIVLAFAVSGCAHRKHDHAAGEHKGHACKEQGCGDKASGKCDRAAKESGVSAATAQVNSLLKSKVKGTVNLSAIPDGVKVSVNLSGLKPNQKQGFHIHEFGNCSAPDGSSAGGHYNPTMAPHADLTAEHRHVGDLGNLQADGKGNVQTDIIVAKASVAELVGRSMVVHGKEDDLKSQPSGAAGDRVGCGVIGLTQ